MATYSDPALILPGAVDTTELKDGAVTNAKVNAAAAVADSKISPVPSTALTTHAALAASVHTLQSDNSELISTAAKAQFRGRGAAGEGGSIYFGIDGTVHLCANCEYNGANWNRIDITKAAWLVVINTPGTQYIYGASAGANPISSWDITSAEPVLRSHRSENVSASAHPNANTHINAPAPHSGHALLSNVNLLIALTPAFSGWNTNPSTNAQLSAENFGSLTTGGVTPAGPATCTILYDLGASKRVVISHSCAYSGGSGGTITIEVSTDGTNYYVMSGSCAYARYVRYSFYTNSGPYTLSRANLRCYVLP